MSHQPYCHKSSLVKTAIRVAIIITFSYSTLVKAVEFDLFGDVSFYTSSDEKEKNSFRLGQVDLIANQEIDPDTKVVVELVFEDAGYHDGPQIDIERLAIQRNISDNMQFGFGRYHTPLGFWNTTYHHGSLIQNTVARPFFLEFEDAASGIMPVHLVGFQLSGAASIIDYQIILGNNNGLNTQIDSEQSHENRLEVFNSVDFNNDKSYVIRVGFNLFDSGLDLGFNYMRNNVIEVGAATGDPNITPSLLDHGEILFEQEITGVSLRGKWGGFQLLSEAYQIQIADNEALKRDGVLIANDNPYTSDAIYTQISYNFSKRLSLALRYETLDFEDNNTYLNVLGLTNSEQRNILSLNYIIGKSNALRFEFNQRNLDDPTIDSVYGYTFQWFFVLL
ncbi:MAG: hypothetical protein ACC707_00150 [Thiohalomonadales bacterium]